MNQPELLKRLATILSEADSTRLFGTIEIEIRDGRPTVLRTLKTERLGDNPYPRDAAKSQI
jgi:hypothetical protein